MEHDTWLRPGEIAKILHVSHSHVLKLIDTKQLIGSKTIGGHRRALRSSVEEYQLKMFIQQDEDEKKDG